MTEAIALPVVRAPADTFRCEKYSCVLTARACVIRQQTVAKNHHTGNVSRSAFNAYCSSGECQQGKAVAAALKGVEVEPPRKQDIAAQFRALRAKANPAAAPKAEPALARVWREAHRSLPASSGKEAAHGSQSEVHGEQHHGVLRQREDHQADAAVRRVDPRGSEVREVHAERRADDVYTSLWVGSQRAPSRPDEHGAIAVIECVFGGRVRLYAIAGDSGHRRVEYDRDWRPA